MKEAVLRLGFISVFVILFLFSLIVLLAQVKDPAVLRLHPVLKELNRVELWDQLPELPIFERKMKNTKNIIGLHLYPSKIFWLASSHLQDKTYFTKEDLKKQTYIKWKTLLKKYPLQKFFVYIHSQNPVDLFDFIEVSEKFKDRLLIYSDFLKTAAWFRKESPLMAIAASPTVLLRMNFFSRLWLEGLVPVRANFAYITTPIRLQVLKELKRRAIVIMINKNLVIGRKKSSKILKKFVENTFLKDNFSYVIKNKGI